MQKGKKSREAGKGRNKVKRVGGKMGKETTKDKACVGTIVQEELEQPQKGHGMPGRELPCKNLPVCPEGITEANKKAPEELQEKLQPACDPKPQ